MKHKKLINIKNSIIKIKILNEKIYVLDINNTLRIFDIDFNLKGGLKIKLPSHKLYENTADISSNGRLLAIANKRKTIIYDISKKTIKYQFSWHKGDVLLCVFDNENRYLLTGGSDSRAYIWSLRLGKMFLALPPHPDYILSGDFSKNNLWVSTGSYDSLVTITNITSPHLNYRKKVHRAAISKIKFFSKNIMVSGDKSGEIVKWDYRKGQVLKRFSNMSDMVVDFDTDNKEEYLFAITKEKKVYLYDFNTGELINKEFIKLNSLPLCIAYNHSNENLYIGCMDGNLYIFDLLEEKQTLKEMLELQEYSKAYNLINKNPILKKTPEYKQLEKIWENSLNKIYNLLEQGEIDKAKEIFSPFSGVSIKRTIFQNILQDYSDFSKFKQAVLTQKYPLAYSLVRHHPSYKDSIYYKQMEKDFKLRLNKAQELIKKGKTEEAKEILKPFRGVSEKAALIQSLFNEKLLYDMLKKLLAKRDFKEFFKFVDRYPFLVDTEEYENAMRYAKAILEKANEAVKKGNYKDAIRYTQVLKDFPKYKDIAQEIQREAENILNFLLYIANRDYDKVEDMVSRYPYLENLDDYKNFVKEYKKLISEGEKYAVAGNIEAIKSLFENYAHYRLFNNLVSQLVKRAYLNQIMSYLKNKDIQKSIRGIKNYIKLFGFDNEIGDLIKAAKKLGADIRIEEYEKSLDIPFSSLPDKIGEVEL